MIELLNLLKTQIPYIMRNFSSTFFNLEDNNLRSIFWFLGLYCFVMTIKIFNELRKGVSL